MLGWDSRRVISGQTSSRNPSQSQGSDEYFGGMLDFPKPVAQWKHPRSLEKKGDFFRFLVWHRPFARMKSSPSIDYQKITVNLVVWEHLDMLPLSHLFKCWTSMCGWDRGPQSWYKYFNLYSHVAKMFQSLDPNFRTFNTSVPVTSRSCFCSFWKEMEGGCLGKMLDHWPNGDRVLERTSFSWTFVEPKHWQWVWYNFPMTDPRMVYLPTFTIQN